MTRKFIAAELGDLVGKALQPIRCNAEEEQIEFFEDTVDISCKVSKSADQLIPYSATTLLTWNQETYDTDNMHDNTTNNSRITINTAGKYSVLVQVNWGSNSIGRRLFILLINGSEIARLEYSPETGSNHQFPWTGKLSAGDYIQVIAWQDSNEDPLEFIGGLSTYFEAHKTN